MARMAHASGSKLIVLIALAGNLVIAISKFIAAFIAGSSAIASINPCRMGVATKESVCMIAIFTEQ